MAYAVIPFELGRHRDALARLWAENMTDERVAHVIPQRMRWMYEQAPEGPATTVLGVVAESGEVVGCGSFLHQPTWVDGRRVPAAVLCDFAITRAHRIAGAALAIQRALVGAARAAGLELLYGYPNAGSLGVFKRIGYRVVGETTAWVKPLRAGYRLRGVRGLRWAAGIAAVPLDAGLRALDVLRAARLPLAVRGAPVPFGDESTGALWDEARAQRGVVGDRSTAYVEWRYGGFPTAPHRTFGVFPRGGQRLAGCAVYTVERGKAFLRDLLAQDLDASADALLLALSDHLRREGVDSLSLSYLGDARFAGRLRKLGFFRRAAKRPVVLHPDAVPESLRARVFDPEAWFMLDGALDI